MKEVKEKIRVICEGNSTLHINKFTNLQGTLKDLPEQNFEKLKNLIIKEGFAFVISVARIDGKVYGILDGHQRIYTIKKMIEDGYTLSQNKLPVAYTDCDDEKHAKRLILAAVSQFGKVNPEGLDTFLAEAELDLAELEEFDLPDFDVKQYLEERLGDAPEGDGEMEQGSTGVLRRDTYCAFKVRFDIGSGVCPLGCVYCFASATPALKHSAVMRPKRKAVILDAIKQAEEPKMMAVGCMTDPCVPEVYENLLYLLTQARKHEVHLTMQTKNPAMLIKAMKETETPPSQIVCKTAFSMLDEKKRKILEPKCPTVANRKEALKELNGMGVDIVVRMQPMFLGYYDGFENFFKEMSFAKVVNVEPFRCCAPGMQYFNRVEPALDEPLLDYLRRWSPNEELETYMAMHWYRTDMKKAHAEFVKIKKMVVKHGMEFGICNGNFGYYSGMLNTHRFCCMCPSHENYPTNPDSDSLCIRIQEKRLHEVQCDSLTIIQPETDDYYTELDRVDMVSNASNVCVGYTDEIIDMTEEALAKFQENEDNSTAAQEKEQATTDN